MEVAEPITMDVDRMATSNLLEVSHQMDLMTMTETMDQAVLMGRRLLADPEDLVDLADLTDLTDLAELADLANLVDLADLEDQVDLVDLAALAIPMDQGGRSDTAVEHVPGMDVNDGVDMRSHMMECPVIADITELLQFQSTMLEPRLATQQTT